jgi:hypothetical protein
LSERLGVYRDDACEHQAGSDSKITAKCFFELKKGGQELLKGCQGEIYGLSNVDKGSFIGNNSCKNSNKVIGSFHENTNNYILSQFGHPVASDFD